MNERLYRSRDDRMIAGVCGGVADRLNVDPSLVRIVWALLILPTGFLALLVYVIMVIVVPDEDDLYRSGSFPAQPGVRPPGPTGSSIGPTPPMVDPQVTALPGPTTPGPIPVGTVPTGGAAHPASQPLTRDQWRAQRHAERLQRHGPRRTGSVSLVVGGALVLIGTWFLIREYLPAISPERFWPIALVGLGILLVVVALSRRSADPGEGPR